MTRECYDPQTREWVPPEEYAARKAARASRENENRALFTPYFFGDLPEYISPVTGQPVDGRRARRDDLKRSGCREVDPGEFKPKYVNREWARKRNLTVED